MSTRTPGPAGRRSVAHRVLATTHTVEMGQISDLNQRLRASRPHTLTASDLGLAGSTTVPAGLLPGDAVLAEVCWDGSPEYPYIHGAFGRGVARCTVTLHTRALRELSRRLHAHHVWGVGSVPDPAVG